MARAGRHVTPQASIAGKVLGVFLIVILALATRFRAFRTVALVTSGLFAAAITALVIFMVFWGTTHRDGGALILMAMLVATFALFAWIVFFALRAVAKDAATKEAVEV